VHDVEAAHTVMAVDDQRTFIRAGFEIGKLAWYRAHGNQHGAFDFGLGELVRLADIDQMKLFSSIDTPFDFLGIDFKARSHHDPSYTGRGVILMCR